MNILALTQSFVRYKDDSKAVFIITLYRELLKKGIHTLVIAPHLKNSKVYEEIRGIKVKRFRYAPSKYESLAYAGIMHERVINSLSGKLLFLFFVSSFILDALKYGKKAHIDLIHAHWWIPSGVVALVIAKMLNKPYVLTSHGTDVFLVKKFFPLKSLAKMIYSKSKLITVVSNSLKQVLTEEIGINPEKIKVFPMPCDLSLFYPVHVQSKDKVILSIGRLTKQKGFDYLIEAIKILKERNINLNLIIIGEGREKEHILKHSQELGLKEIVQLVPYQPKAKLNYYYNMCNIFVLPSITDLRGRQEGLGLVLLEAMACKKPVIGTNTGGIPDIVKDGKTGLLVPEKDSHALANAIEKLLKDKSLAKTLAENGYRYSTQKFSASKIAEYMFEVYSEAVGLKKI